MPVKKKSVLKGSSARITVNVFDGAQQPIGAETDLFIRIRDGVQKEIHAKQHRGPSVAFRVPFNNNFQDLYTVLVSADGYRQAGFTPVPVNPDLPRSLDLMLIPRSFKFRIDRWDELPQAMRTLMSAGGAGPDDGEVAFKELRKNRPAVLAAMLNILTAMGSAFLAHGTPFDYLTGILWDELADDRFYAFADALLLDELETAASAGVFERTPGSSVFHPGATRSFKQVEFGEANVQLTFHETETATIDGVACVKIEPDIDYYRSQVSHTLLEVLPNTLSGAKTDAATAYVLRWMAGRFAGIPPFSPPFRIVAA
jgi:hypothetical protein